MTDNLPDDVKNAIAADRLDEAGALASQHYGGEPCFLFERDVLPVPFSVVKWHIEAAAKATITINATMPRDRAPFFANHLTLALPLLVAYHRANPERGSIYLGLDDNGAAPGLAFCANHEEMPLIPDPIFLAHRGYQATRDYFSQNSIPWEERAPIAIWRGSTTGGRLGSSWRNLPRIRLCEIANYPETSALFDVGINHIGQVTPEEEAEIQSSGLMRDYMPMAGFGNYRFQIDIDGNTNSWPGLFQKLLTGSPVLKVASPGGFRQWYYDRLIPWQNYVPVESDMRDLIDKVRWLIAHDDEAREIGLRGATLAHAMTYDSELQRGVETISSAIRHSFVDATVLADISFGNDGNSREFIGDGWSHPEEQHTWTLGRQSTISLATPEGPGRYALELDASGAQCAPCILGQRLIVRVNDVAAARTILSANRVFIVPLSAADLTAPLMRIQFDHPCAFAPSDHGIGSDPREVAIAFRRLRLLRA